MKRSDVLVRTRRQARDVAAARLREREDELARLEEAQARLAQALRDEVAASASGAGSLSPRRLELLDLARRAANDAVDRGRLALESARTLAIESEIALKQVEKLRDRQRQEIVSERRRLEQRSTDAVAGRGKVMSLLLVLAMLAPGACNKGKEEGAKETPAATKKEKKAKGAKDGKHVAKKTRRRSKSKAPRDAVKRWADARDVKAGDKNQDAAEKRLLEKLRERSEKLRQSERKMEARQKELTQLELRVREMLDKIGTIQTSLEKRLAGASTRPTSMPTSSLAKKQPASRPTEATKAKAKAAKEALAKRASTSSRKGSQAETARAKTFGKGPFAAVIGRMPEKAAATVLSNMDPREAARALLALSRAKAAKILARLSEESSGAVGDAMAALQWPPKREASPQKGAEKRPKGRVEKSRKMGRKAKPKGASKKRRKIRRAKGRERITGGGGRENEPRGHRRRAPVAARRGVGPRGVASRLLAKGGER